MVLRDKNSLLLQILKQMLNFLSTKIITCALIKNSFFMFQRELLCPSEPLSTIIPASSIAAVNEEVKLPGYHYGRKEKGGVKF